MPIIREGFTNISGKHYDKVREIAYKKGNLFCDGVRLVAETKYEDNMFFDSSFNLTNGVTIRQLCANPNVAYRVYKSFADYKFNGWFDDKLIQKLIERQEKIKLSKFPTGVVTMDGYIIGQEIPYYPDDITLYEYFTKYQDVDYIKVYRAVLEVLKEMYDNGIIYTDSHAKNFMINPLLDDIKIDVIDFEYERVKFDDDLKYCEKHFFNNYITMVNRLNMLCGLYFIVGEMQYVMNFDDIYEQLDTMNKILIRRK